MRKWMAACVLAAAAMGAQGQEGFPLDGTWRGDLQGARKTPVTIVMVLQWDGHKVSGLINPGPTAIAVGEASLNPEGWLVSIAGTTPAGKPVNFAGRLAELGTYHRSIDGTWTEGGHKYPLRLVRD